ncbi:hypothetical protein DB347_01325 [Opitutaceae bacterium EW11]|nr:hypothetical protein DB347_01325 [Opitutaceae bacterium EW11]
MIRPDRSAPRRNALFVARAVALAGVLAWGRLSPAAVEGPAPIDSAAGVLSLTGEQAAQRLPIVVKGVITAAEGDWNGQFFIQDATAGVFVENLHQLAPKPGDLVIVRGVSHPGAFAPIISQPKWEKLGVASLPEPKSVLIEDLESGIDDGLRVEIEGVVRAVHPSPTRTTLELAVGGRRLQVCAPAPALTQPESLIASRVRVRGTTATHYNAALRHLTSVAVYVPAWEDVSVLEPEAEDPFTLPLLALKQVAEYRRGSGPSQRLHVRGTVTYQRIGDAVFLEDDTGGLRIQTSAPDVFSVGEQVEAAGFIEYENHLPLLRDAVFRKVPAPSSPRTAHPARMEEFRQGLRHASLVTMGAKVLDRTVRPVSRPASGFTGTLTTWLLQGEDLSYTADIETAGEKPTWDDIPVGSVVEMSGVADLSVDMNGKLQSLKLLLPSPASIRVVAKPSWFTPERLLIGIGLISAVLVVAVGWLLTVSRKNTALKTVIREREQAQQELQEAHDTLEEKVEERTAQLQFEMGARKTAEVQFKAVLAERTRLARDLHDTLEQTLTGIGLQLDTAARLFERSPDECQRHLLLARSCLQQSQFGLRRSIWDLRSRELEQFDLPRALQQSGDQLLSESDIALRFSATGERRALPEVVEENVLRIGQEAFTNIAKHARAKNVAAELQFSPTGLGLRIVDDGVGFDPDRDGAVGDSHFGLIGMAERAKRVGGFLTIQSTPGRGTTIQVEIPLEPVVPAAAPSTPTPS